MRLKIFFVTSILLSIFIFIVFYKGLSNTSIYTPLSSLNKAIPKLSAQTLFNQNYIQSNEIFDKKKFYILNIWASWCVPCREEHPLLMELNKLNNLEVLGLNYKDNLSNAKEFIQELGNPYSIIFLDTDGTKSIEWGAYGVPETFLINDNKVIKKFIGPLTAESISEIKKIVR